MAASSSKSRVYAHSNFPISSYALEAILWFLTTVNIWEHIWVGKGLKINVNQFLSCFRSICILNEPQNISFIKWSQSYFLLILLSPFDWPLHGMFPLEPQSSCLQVHMARLLGYQYPTSHCMPALTPSQPLKTCLHRKELTFLWFVPCSLFKVQHRLPSSKETAQTTYLLLLESPRLRRGTMRTYELTT